MMNEDEEEEEDDEVKRPHKCTKCGSRFLKKAHLDRHTSSVHSDQRPFLCPSCPKTFKRASHLKRHEENAHSIEKGEICGECGKAFGGSEQLRRHLKRHRKNKIDDNISVNSIMSRRDELKKVVVVDDYDEKKEQHRCEVCGKYFTRLRGLRLHLRSRHHRLKNGEVIKDDDLELFPCRLCGLDFSTSSNRNAHMRVKHPGGSRSQFTCSRCGFESAYRHVVIRHEKNIHEKGGAKREKTACEEEKVVDNKKCRYDVFGRTRGPSSLFTTRIGIGIGSSDSDDS